MEKQGDVIVTNAEEQRLVQGLPAELFVGDATLAVLSALEVCARFRGWAGELDRGKSSISSRQGSCLFRKRAQEAFRFAVELDAYMHSSD